MLLIGTQQPMQNVFYIYESDVHFYKFGVNKFFLVYIVHSVSFLAKRFNVPSKVLQRLYFVYNNAPFKVTFGSIKIQGRKWGCNRVP